MTNIVKTHPSKVDIEGEQLWYALFALRQLTARWHVRNTGQVPSLGATNATVRAHQNVVSGFFCEMGRKQPKDAR